MDMAFYDAWKLSVKREQARRCRQLQQQDRDGFTISADEYDWATMQGDYSEDAQNLYTVQPDGSVLQERVVL